MSADSSAIRLILHVVEGEDTVDVDDGVACAITVQMKLLGSAAQVHPAFKLDIRDGILENLS